MKKHKGRKTHRKPNREQMRRNQALEQRDSLKFYKTMCAALVRRAGGRLTIAKEEFEGMVGMLQWRKTEKGGVEFLFVTAPPQTREVKDD